MGPNILLVIFDAARASNFGNYGHYNNTDPFLRAFAGEATCYTQARSPSTWSLPSHTSLFTGFQVVEHQVTSRYDRLSRGHTIWERLRDEHGYDTAVFSENPFITSDLYGLNAGFDEVVTGLPSRSYPFKGTTPTEYLATGQSENNPLGYLLYAIRSQAPARSIANALVRQAELNLTGIIPEWLATHRGNESHDYADAFLNWQSGRTKWAACINFTDVHYPYEPVSEHDLWGGRELAHIHDALEDPRWSFYAGRRPWWQRAAIEALYDGCLRQVDQAIKRIVQQLRVRGQLENTLVVVTADHGEGFGEPSRVRDGFRIAGHAGGIHERLLHVPLVVYWPDKKRRGTVTEAATLTNFPTVVEGLLEGSEAPGFVPSGPVIATADLDAQYEYSPKNLELFREDIDESMFGGLARAVYRDQNGDKVRKFAHWDDDTAVIDVYNATTAVTMASQDNVISEIEQAFTNLSNQGVREPNEREQGLDSDTRQRLEDLGYV